MKTDNLINRIVKINIKNPEGYTSDLYKSIQSKAGIIIEKNSNRGCYKDAWLVKFGKDALNTYKKTHSGKWGANDRMEWWIESKDFEVQ